MVDGLAYRIIRTFYFRQAYLVGWLGRKRKRVVVGHEQVWQEVQELRGKACRKAEEADEETDKETDPRRHASSHATPDSSTHTIAYSSCKFFVS